MAVNQRTMLFSAFSPSMEITKPEAFAGRQSLIPEMADALRVSGSCILIYGDRGLGKTSLALQLARIALGDDELLNSIDSNRMVFSEDEAFAVFWTVCSDETRNKTDIIQRMINTAEGYTTISDLEEHRATTIKDRLTLKLPLLEAETISQCEASGRKYSSLDIEEKFIAVLDRLDALGLTRVLFVIDELDRVGNTDGLASFIKNNSRDDTRFVLVGITNTVSKLIRDHESLERKLTPVQMQLMNADELEEIVLKAMRVLSAAGIEVSFTPEATSLLAGSAGGYPWFVHAIGHEALIDCWDSGARVVKAEHVERAIAKLTSNRFAQRFSDTYRVAVGDSPQREIVLRLLAKWRGDDVYLSEIYPLAHALGVSNPSVCKRDLVEKKHGQVITTPPDRDKGVVRFSNRMFARYTELRSSLYRDVKEQVDEIWARRP
jgi:Cdc6-like AAA superfamily ATPase